MHNYADAFGGFPPGRIVNVSPGDNLTASANGNATTGTGDCFSAFAQLLPQLDQTVIFSQIDFNNGPDTTSNNSISIIQPPVFVCPSDSGLKSLAQGTGFAGVTNYVMNTGTTFSVSPKNPSNHPVTGIFFENSFVKIGHITDGTSQTVCLSEQVLSNPNDTTNNAGNWTGGTPSTGFVLTTGNNNTNAGPELLNYPGDCVAGGKLQLTRGNRLLYGAGTHDVQPHPRPERQADRLSRWIAS